VFRRRSTKTINPGGCDRDLWSAAAIDALLALGFGLHHSVTARRSFKRWWTQFVPAFIPWM